MLRLASRVGVRQAMAPRASFAPPVAAPVATAAARFAPGDVPEPLRGEIAGLIGQERVVVFLTGTPQAPRCGFTVRMVELLQQFQVKYAFVNILEDDDVCEGLKAYSDWPTYPQMYVDKELVGGYDLVKTMALDGSLVKLLKDKELL